MASRTTHQTGGPSYGKEKELFLDILTKEEKEALLNKKMEEIRKKNEALRKRHELIEADKRQAEKLSKGTPQNTSQSEGPPRRNSAREREKREQMKGVQGDREERKSKFSTGRGKRLQHMAKEKLQAPSLSSPRGSQNEYENRRNQTNFRSNAARDTREPKAPEPQSPDGPPPDPRYNFLADRSREGPLTEGRDSSRRHPRNFGGSNFGEVKVKINEKQTQQGKFRTGPPKSRMEMEMRMTGRERREYMEWKEERDKIDRARIDRQRKADGDWKREWDHDKAEQERRLAAQNAESDEQAANTQQGYNRSRRNWQDEPLSPRRTEPGRRPDSRRVVFLDDYVAHDNRTEPNFKAGRIGSGRFDRGEREERQRGEAPGTKGSEERPDGSMHRGGMHGGRGRHERGDRPRRYEREHCDRDDPREHDNRDWKKDDTGEQEERGSRRDHNEHDDRGWRRGEQDERGRRWGEHDDRGWKREYKEYDDRGYKADRGGRGGKRGGRGGRGGHGPPGERPQRARVSSWGSDDRSVEEQNDSLVIKIDNEFVGKKQREPSRGQGQRGDRRRGKPRGGRGGPKSPGRGGRSGQGSTGGESPKEAWMVVEEIWNKDAGEDWEPILDEASSPGALPQPEAQHQFSEEREVSAKKDENQQYKEEDKGSRAEGNQQEDVAASHQPGDEEWEDAEEDAEFYESREHQGDSYEDDESELDTSAELAAELADLENSSLRLTVAGLLEPLGITPYNPSDHSPYSPTDPTSPGSSLKTPEGHIKVLDWGAEMDDQYMDSRESGAAEELSFDSNPDSPEHIRPQKQKRKRDSSSRESSKSRETPESVKSVSSSEGTVKDSKEMTPVDEDELPEDENSNPQADQTEVAKSFEEEPCQADLAQNQEQGPNVSETWDKEPLESQEPSGTNAAKDETFEPDITQKEEPSAPKTLEEESEKPSVPDNLEEELKQADSSKSQELDIDALQNQEQNLASELEQDDASSTDAFSDANDKVMSEADDVDQKEDTLEELEPKVQDPQAAQNQSAADAVQAASEPADREQKEPSADELTDKHDSVDSQLCGTSLTADDNAQQQHVSTETEDKSDVPKTESVSNEDTPTESKDQGAESSGSTETPTDTSS